MNSYKVIASKKTIFGVLFGVLLKGNASQNAVRRVFAEREGFEPPDPLRSTVFKTAAFDHSAISPLRTYVLWSFSIFVECKYRDYIFRYKINAQKIRKFYKAEKGDYFIAFFFLSFFSPLSSTKKNLYWNRRR